MCSSTGLEFSALCFFARSGHVGVLFFPACEGVVTRHVLAARALLVRDRHPILPLSRSFLATDTVATGGCLNTGQFSRVSNMLVSMSFLFVSMRTCQSIREQRLRSCDSQQSRHFATFTRHWLAVISTTTVVVLHWCGVGRCLWSTSNPQGTCSRCRALPLLREEGIAPLTL